MVHTHVYSYGQKTCYCLFWKERLLRTDRPEILQTYGCAPSYTGEVHSDQSHRHLVCSALDHQINENVKVRKK